MLPAGLWKMHLHGVARLRSHMCGHCKRLSIASTDIAGMLTVSTVLRLFRSPWCAVDACKRSVGTGSDRGQALQSVNTCCASSQQSLYAGLQRLLYPDLLLLHVSQKKGTHAAADGGIIVWWLLSCALAQWIVCVSCSQKWFVSLQVHQGTA